jgi:hypothetical protein
MRIAYLCTDEVNLNLAEAMAAACGLTLCPLFPKDSPPDEEFDAVLYDGDSWPADRLQEVLAELPAVRHPRVVAVRGYNLGDGQAEAFRRNAVAVFRPLQPRVFLSLRRAIHTARAAQARERNSQDRQATGQPGGLS